MRQFVLTRSAYGTAWDLDANRRRLDLTRRVTVSSMAAQTMKDWEWLVAIDISDPLADERMRVFEAAGVPVRFIEVRSDADRSSAAFAHYRAPWNDLLGPRGEWFAMTRLDDDDALASWVLERVRRSAWMARERTVLMLPRGVRVWDGRMTLVRHDSNAMHTLVTPPGDDLHVYAYGHRDVRKVARVRTADERIAWVWSRHEDTISGWRDAVLPLNERITGMFPAIDWSVFGQPRKGRPARMVGAKGAYFR